MKFTEYDIREINEDLFISVLESARAILATGKRHGMTGKPAFVATTACYKGLTLNNVVSYFMPKASVNVQRGRLYLLARLPRKDGKPGTTPQRIPTGLFDTPADHRIADRQRVTAAEAIGSRPFLLGRLGTRTRRPRLGKKRDADACSTESVSSTAEQVRPHGRSITWAGCGNCSMTATLLLPRWRGRGTCISRYSREQCSYKELYYLLIDLCQTNLASPFLRCRCLPTARPR